VGSQSVRTAAGDPSRGSSTAKSSCHMPFSSKRPKSGAMWFIVAWQFAQMTELVSWKSTRPPLSSPEIESIGQGAV
jgi:hypothetical protein